MRKTSRILILVFVAAVLGSATSAPARPTHSVPYERAVSRRVAWCSPGVPMYQEVYRELRKKPLRTLTIYTMGRWTYQTGGRVARKGCIAPAAFRRFRAHLVKANFTPPKDRYLQCDAVTMVFITYRDLLRKRSASSSHPCGSRANADVHQLSKLIHGLVDTRPKQPGRP